MDAEDFILQNDIQVLGSPDLTPCGYEGNRKRPGKEFVVLEQGWNNK